MFIIKNKKILFILIICGLALALASSLVSAADYICRCNGTGTTFYNDWPSCQNGCGNDCPSGQSPSCAEIKDSTSADRPSSAGQTTAGKLTNPLGTTSLPKLIGRVISAFLGIVGSIALLMFIYGGFLWMTSHGNEQQITKGKNVLVWAIIGLAVIFLSYTLVGFVIKGLTRGGATGAAGEVNVEGEGLIIGAVALTPRPAAVLQAETRNARTAKPFMPNPAMTCPYAIRLFRAVAKQATAPVKAISRNPIAQHSTADLRPEKYAAQPAYASRNQRCHNHLFT
jgi:hypothetical protein